MIVCLNNCLNIKILAIRTKVEKKNSKISLLSEIELLMTLATYLPTMKLVNCEWISTFYVLCYSAQLLLETAVTCSTLALSLAVDFFGFLDFVHINNVTNDS